MTLRLNGSTSGYVEIDSQAVGGNNTIQLPSSNGSANQFLKNGSTAGTLGWSSMVEDSSGRLLVGTSSSVAVDVINSKAQIEHTDYDASLTVKRNSNGDGGPLQIFVKSRGTANGSNTVVQNGDTLGQLRFFGTDGTDPAEGASIAAQVDGTPGNNDMPGRLVFATTSDNASSPTERMRIKSNGFTELANDGTIANGNSHVIRSSLNEDTLFVRNSNASLSNMVLRLAAARNTSNGSYNFFNCVREGVENVLFIRDSGNVVNTNNSYGAISDIKLKENIIDASSQWDDIKALQVRKYNFKEGQTHTQIGLVAQEVELVSPGLVSETIDRDDDGNDLGTTTKSVNYSVLYMKAVKALQEAMERIETLEASNADLAARLTALEAA